MLAKPEGEPIEEFGMSRERAHPAKIVRRIDKPAAKMVLPDAIHNRAAHEHVFGIRDPSRERSAALAFVVRVGAVEIRPRTRNEGQPGRRGEFEWAFYVAARQQMHGADAVCGDEA